ncbi:MAG TPA: GYF domain-containing protein [Polyangiaceae bacterium]|nr:GYF domain-containing protein [Polyangiaceae bacterium]
MIDPAQDVHYYWLAADGARLSGSGHDLRAALRSGALRPSTLVWRSGWAEWLPADRIAELAAAIAEAAAAPSSFGTLGPPRRVSSPARPSTATPPPPSRARAPMPTLSEEQSVAPATATLRPPGAVPPPARGVPVPALDSSPRATMTPVPSFGPPGGRIDTPLPTTLPAVVNRALLAEPPPASTEPSLDSTREVVPDVPAEARRTPVPLPLGARTTMKSSAEAESNARRFRQESRLMIGSIEIDGRIGVVVLSVVSSALLAALVTLWLSRSPSKSPMTQARPQTSSASPPAIPLAVPGCRLALPAARIAASVERSVPPYTATLEKTRDLLVGIAETKSKGLGLRLDPNTLDVFSVFEEDGKDALRGVVPLTRSGSSTFFVDRDDRALRSAHTIDEVPPFTLGIADGGFSRVVAGSSSVIWPLDPSAKITEPRSAQLAGHGYGVTFRRGGKSGKVMLGFVANDGAKRSELTEVPGAPKLLGTPVIAGSSTGALVAFAGRDAEDAAWRLFVSRALPGAEPSPARELTAGSGGGAISPALAALSGDRWLVQWTEGSSAQFHVHVQSFTADLEPIGQSIVVSPKGANAGQGALATFAGGAATLFILTTAGQDELWGATLACQ